MNLFHMRDLAYLVYFNYPDDLALHRSVATMCTYLLKDKQNHQNEHLKEMTKGIYKQIFVEDYRNENNRSGLVAYCFLYHRETLIVFRGSESYSGESSAAGWQDWEDNIDTIYQQNTLQEKAALKYVETYKNAQSLSLCGHSKGGKLAIYASLHVCDDMFDKIDRVVAFNAPGISQETKQTKKARIKSDEYQQKVVLVNNEYDIVSALFYSVVRPMFVQSIIKGTDLKTCLLAHGLYAYKEDGMHFVKAKHRALLPSEVHIFFNDVILRLPSEELRILTLPIFAYFALDTPLETVIRYIVSILHQNEAVMAKPKNSQTYLMNKPVVQNYPIVLMDEEMVNQHIQTLQK